MPPSSLQGLNIIRPAQDSPPADSRDLLLGQAYPDLSAQLDLWTSLNFESDDPLATENNEHKKSLRFLTEEVDDDERSTVIDEKDGQPNLVTPSNQVQSQNNPGLVNPAAVAAAAAAAAQSFDLNAFLASLGLDSFAAAAAVAAAAPHQHNSQLQQTPLHPQIVAPSLAQILALHSVHNVGYPPPGFLPYPLPPVNPSSTVPTSTPFRDAHTSEESYGPAKRPRTRSTSITINSSEDGSPSSGTAPSTPNAMSSHPSPPGLTPLSAAEDKRRRNTAASARFRLKKKEREAALETKSKELETKVVELERECEALRRENGWLKGLVVGVTGAAAQAPSGQGLVPPAS